MALTKSHSPPVSPSMSAYTELSRQLLTDNDKDTDWTEKNLSEAPLEHP